MVTLPLAGARLRALRHRIAARRAARARPATGFRSRPEPRTIGQPARGRQILAGNLHFAGHLVEVGDRSPWEIEPPDAAFAEALHGFAWLDDLCAVGDGRARARAVDWTMGWITACGDGTGPGWTPPLTARRVIRQINHAVFLLRGQDAAMSGPFFRSLGQQALFLSRTWRATEPGLPRIEALAGTIQAVMTLTGMEDQATPAVDAMTAEGARIAAAGGTVPSRSPEDLLEVLTFFNWAALAIGSAGRTVPGPILDAIAAMVPTLRALRHGDGGLARFHGGGRGQPGRLDQALLDSGERTRPPRSGHAMGYAHLKAGRTSLIVDAASPVPGPTAHASTLAFELTSGRRPVIVTCGAGGGFGAEWRRAGRATASHSTLILDRRSTARMVPGKRPGAPDRLTAGPADVRAEITAPGGATRLEASHDGYRGATGLIHGRTLNLGVSGRELAGEDHLVALTAADRGSFDRALDDAAPEGIPFAIRFHLHPEAEAALDAGGAAVSITLRSGEVWVLRHDSACEMEVRPSAWLEAGRLRPRAAWQVVLSGRAMSYATQVRWSLAKAQETPGALRDLMPDEAEEELETVDD